MSVDSVRRTPPSAKLPGESRRDFLVRTAQGLGALALGPTFAACGSEGDFDYSTVPQTSNLANLGDIGEPDENGLRLPPGFTSRIIARSGQVVAGTDYKWHGSPDGAATFALPDGGYIYTSNCESPLLGGGGAGVIVFDRDGKIRDAYKILGDTTSNCGGGPTPWGTWMSGEEIEGGLIWECDPHGIEPAVSWPLLGAFTHEAVAFDPGTGCAYLTEDRPDGRFYRFTPDVFANGRPDLSSGKLEALRMVGVELEGPVVWELVPNPSGVPDFTRNQAPSTAFNGGEGIWFYEGTVYFTTKGDNRMRAYDVAQSTISIVYDAADYAVPVLTGVDNIVILQGGDVLVCEDGGDMQVVLVTPSGEVKPIAQVVGHTGSEITGIALDPHRRRLYFSSQRGTTSDVFTGGFTFEVTGPFFI